MPDAINHLGQVPVGAPAAPDRMPVPHLLVVEGAEIKWPPAWSLLRLSAAPPAAWPDSGAFHGLTSYSLIEWVYPHLRQSVTLSP